MWEVNPDCNDMLVKDLPSDLMIKLGDDPFDTAMSYVPIQTWAEANENCIFSSLASVSTWM